MEITEVRIKLMEEPGERLKAFCSITFDDSFVVRDLKIIEGSNGPFVAMPSRKLTAHCPKCRCKNHLRAGYCNQCGGRLRENQAVRDEDGRAKLYADIAHPINSACREMIQDRVIESFQTEGVMAERPDYISSYDDLDHDDQAAAEPARKAKPSVVESTGVEEADQPRGPHKSPARESTSSEESGDDNFGAGIF